MRLRPASCSLAAALAIACSPSAEEPTVIPDARGDSATTDVAVVAEIDSPDAADTLDTGVDSAPSDDATAEVEPDTKPEVEEDVAPTCSDKKKNGGETDVDCGGGTCPKCDDGLACSTDADCAGADCYAGFCSPPPYINYLSPTKGPVAGATKVRINGGNFYVGGKPGIVLITFDGKSADAVSYLGSYEMQMETPPGKAPGVVKVVVKNAYGRTVESSYTYE